MQMSIESAFNEQVLQGFSQPDASVLKLRFLPFKLPRTTISMGFHNPTRERGTNEGRTQK
jgi:hypothetical protein